MKKPASFSLFWGGEDGMVLLRAGGCLGGPHSLGWGGSGGRAGTWQASLVICSCVLRQANHACLRCGTKAPLSKSSKPQDPRTFQVSTCIPKVKPSHRAKLEAVWTGSRQAQRHGRCAVCHISLFLWTRNCTVSELSLTVTCEKWERLRRGAVTKLGSDKASLI